MDEKQRRKAANEVVFREVNERIAELQQHPSMTDEPLRIVCECDRLECTEPLAIEVDLYERVRNDATAFFVVPGHEDPAVEDVVDTGDGFLIVRKRSGGPADVARAADPRSQA